MKKIITVVLFASFLLSAYAQAKLGFADEDAASVGIYVKDLRTGQVIAQNAPKQALLPASTMKAVTASAALGMLGSDFQFSTPVLLYGSQSNGVWKGNLVINSCGDPTIESELFKDRTPLWQTIVTALKEKGISAIDGTLEIRESLADAGCIPQWEIDDVPWAYGAGLHGFNFADNCYSLWPATKKSQPKVPELELVVEKDISGNDMSRGINSDLLIVKGPNITSDKWRMTPSFNNPAASYLILLKEKLVSSGIDVNEKKYSNTGNPTTLCVYQSPVMSDIVREMLYESHNLFAEGLLRALSMGHSRDMAIDAEASFFRRQGLNPKCNKICDGSGLARADRLQPIFISDMLEHASKSKYSDVYVSSFPLAGVNGTVKSLLAETPLKGKLALKSGSMNAVQCFAGYKLDDNGHPTHTVVILVNSFFCPRSELRTSIEDFLVNTFPQ